MARAEKLISDTIAISETEALDIQVWKVPKTKDHPEGIRYSYNYRLFIGVKLDRRHQMGQLSRHKTAYGRQRL